MQNVFWPILTGDTRHRLIFLRPFRRDVRLDDPLRLPLPSLVGQGDWGYDAAPAHPTGALRGRHSKLQILYEQQLRRKTPRGKRFLNIH